MIREHLAQITLNAIGAAFMVVAIQGLWAPTLLLAPVEIELTTSSALAEVRAGYGGCFGGLALAMFAAAREVAWRRLALALAAVVLGLFVVGRLVSLGMDGSPNAFSLFILALEGSGALLCWGVWRLEASSS